jgi:hypothetical protein
MLGRVIADKYVIEALLGEGAMGRVYRAVQRPLDKLVAVKVLHAALGFDELAQGRFLREAKAASRIDHPNSVQVFDFGTLPEGVAFLVMEYLRGRDLAARIRQDKRLSPALCVELMGQVLSALTVAHEAGVVHRDLKPENILLVGRPGDDGGEMVKVADFGIAKLLEGGEKLTTTGLVAGTPAYMSPENGEGKPLDPRSDLYACGVILYEMVTGVLPFRADNALAVVIKHITEKPMPPSSLVPDIPPGLEAVILRALAKRPDDRFEDARAMRAALRQCLGDEAASGVRASAVPRVSGVAPPAAADTVATMVAPAATPVEAAVVTATKRRALPPVAIVSIAAAVATGVGVLVLGARGSAPAVTVSDTATHTVTREAPPSPPAAPAAPPVAPPAARPAPALLAPEAVPEIVPQVMPGGAPVDRAHRRHAAPTAPPQAAAHAAPAAPTPAPAPAPEAAPTPPAPPPAPAPAPAPVVAAAAPPPPERPAPAAEPSPLRGVSTAVSGLAVTGGLGRGQFSPRADRAAADLGRCVAQAGRDQPGFTAPATATVSLRVRDQRLDEARVAGLPGFARACEGSVRGAFDGSLPAADDAEYDLRFSVTLTPQR